jgi:hypothetical protein
LACGLVLASTCLLHAQVVQETRTVTTPGGTTEIRRVSQLIGSNVQLQGTNFGRVEDVVLDNNGGIGYVVVGNNGRYAMLPWNAANVNYGQRMVSYTVTPQAVQPLFFAPNAWPNITDQQFITRTQKVFPNATVRREALRPAVGVLPPGGPVVEKDKIKVKPNGTVKETEKTK